MLSRVRALHHVEDAAVLRLATRFRRPNDPKPDHFVCLDEYTDRAVAATDARGDESIGSMHAFEVETRMSRIADGGREKSSSQRRSDSISARSHAPIASCSSSESFCASSIARSSSLPITGHSNASPSCTKETQRHSRKRIVSQKSNAVAKPL